MNKLLSLILLVLVAAPSTMAFAPRSYPHQRRNFEHHHGAFGVRNTQLNVVSTFPPPEESSANGGVTGGIIPLGEEDLLANFNNKETISNNNNNNRVEQELMTTTRTALNIESVVVSTAGAVFISMLLMAGLSNPVPELSATVTTNTATTFTTKIVKQEQIVPEETIDQMIDQSAGFYFF